MSKNPDKFKVKNTKLEEHFKASYYPLNLDIFDPKMNQ